MTWTRRNLLRAGGVAVATGLAGCGCCPPTEFTRVALAVEETFRADEPPYEVPVTVEVSLGNPGSDEVGLGGVTLHALDVDRAPIATAELGEFTYRNADPERQEHEEQDTEGACGSGGMYRAKHTVDRTLETPAVPELITVSLRRVWFDDDEITPADRGTRTETDVAADAALLMSCAYRPEVTVVTRRYAGERPPTELVEPSDYEDSRVEFFEAGEYAGGPVLPPESTPTPTPSPDNRTSTNRTMSNDTAVNGTATDHTPGNYTGTGDTSSENRTATGGGTPDGND